MPASPGPLSPGPLSPNRQMSVTSVTADLPSDTQKFLRFAGKKTGVIACMFLLGLYFYKGGAFALFYTLVEGDENSL